MHRETAGKIPILQVCVDHDRSGRGDHVQCLVAADVIRNSLVLAARRIRRHLAYKTIRPERQGTHCLTRICAELQRLAGRKLAPRSRLAVTADDQLTFVHLNRSATETTAGNTELGPQIDDASRGSVETEPDGWLRHSSHSAAHVQYASIAID